MKKYWTHDGIRSKGQGPRAKGWQRWSRQSGMVELLDFVGGAKLGLYEESITRDQTVLLIVSHLQPSTAGVIA